MFATPNSSDLGNAAPSSADAPERNSSVLAQLKALQQTQDKQMALMRTLGDRMSEVLGMACPGRDTAHVAHTPSHCTSTPRTDRTGTRDELGQQQVDGTTRRNIARKADWTWDPEVQDNLDKSFEVHCEARNPRTRPFLFRCERTMR